MSGVPHGSVLGPVLFLIYINDLEDDISSKVLKFADNTKVFRKVTNDTDKQSLPDDLDKLVKWSEKWHVIQFWEVQMYTHRTWKHGRRI